MSEQTAFDPNAPVPLETLIGAPFNLIVETWETAQPASNLDPELLSRAPTILEAVGWLTGHQGLDRLRNAISTRDEHALGALVQLNNYLGIACDKLIERCIRWRHDNNWTDLRHEAGLAIRFTAASGRYAQRALAWFLLATVYRAFGDNKGAVDAYKGAIEAASTVRDEHLLAVANDNLGNALADLGRLDEALYSYEEALRHELDPNGRNAIQNNRSNVLRMLGELRSAAQAQQDSIAELERAGITGLKLAVALDNAAATITELSEPAVALKMLERASRLFDLSALADRAVNALNRSMVLDDLGDKNGTVQAFVEAHDLAFEHARKNIDPEHYRRGFLTALAARLSSHDEANQLIIEGMAAMDADRFGEALQLFQRASQRARTVGDHALALRIDANAAVVLSRAGDYDQALTIATQVRHEAATRGFARPELMAIATLESLAATGVDIHEPLGPLGSLARSAALLEMHTRVVADAGLNPRDAILETYDPGTIANELALQAEAHHAEDLAVRYYHEAIEKARAVQGWFELANRLAGLRFVLAKSGKAQEADTIADELERFLATGVLHDRGQLVAHRALGFHFADRDRMVAIGHLKQACAILEGLSQQIVPGTGRADVARQMQGLYHILARLLRQSGDATAAFEALQGEKGRRLIDALAALAPGDGPVRDAPPKADEVMALIGSLGGDDPTILVDLAVEEEGLTAYLVESGSVLAIHVTGSPSNLAGIEQGDVFEREARLVGLCLSERLLGELAEALTTKIPKGCRLLLVPDLFLHNLPLHVVPVRGRPWCEHFSIGYLPAAGVLRFAPSRRAPVGRALVAGDSRSDLPYAAAECANVAAVLGNKPLVGSQCTRAAIEAELQAGELDVVHFALHGRGDAQRGGRASLLLADGAGGIEWVAFDELAAFPWRVELVVFSGCSTAVVGPRQGHELIGVARAAVERGAAAVIACLWPVGDQAANVFMTAFYKELVSRHATGAVDLRLVLDRARDSLRTWLATVSTSRVQRRDGRNLRPVAMEMVERPQMDPVVADALAWGPFILLGDPIMGN